MKIGTVVVLGDGVVGTVIGKVSDDDGDKLEVLTKNGYIRHVKAAEVYPWQDGIKSEEKNDVGIESKSEIASHKRKGSK